MIEKLTTLGFIGTAHAQQSFFDIFRPFEFTPGPSARSTFTAIVANVLTWVLAVVAIIAFVYLVINGVKYITAGGDAAKATEARNGIVNAIIGIVVVVISYFILRFAINLGANLINRGG